MSSVLKALQKLEADKIKCQVNQQGIDARILQNSSSRSYSRYLLSLIAVTIFVSGSGATYFIMKKESSKLAVKQIISLHNESKLQTPVSKVMPSIIQSNTVQVETPTLLSPKTSKTLVVRDFPNNNPSKSNLLPAKRVEIMSPQDTIPVSVPPSATVRAVIKPTLNVNGIAFQEGGSDNMAVINGMTVSNGSIIEGVMVEDIQKDRVRFSQAGEKFEIILNKSNK
jgi:cell division protein FtsN